MLEQNHEEHTGFFLFHKAQWKKCLMRDCIELLMLMVHRLTQASTMASALYTVTAQIMLQESERAVPWASCGPVWGLCCQSPASPGWSSPLLDQTGLPAGSPSHSVPASETLWCSGPRSPDTHTQFKWLNSLWTSCIHVSPAPSSV